MKSFRDTSPVEFEHWVAAYLANTGYGKLNVQGGRSDRGIDITCENSSGGRVVVQCKKYQPGNKVTASDIERFNGTGVKHKADEMIFVTSSSYTEDARRNSLFFGVTIIQGSDLEIYESLVIANQFVLAKSEAKMTNSKVVVSSRWLTASNRLSLDRTALAEEQRVANIPVYREPVDRAGPTPVLKVPTSHATENNHPKVRHRASLASEHRTPWTRTEAVDVSRRRQVMPDFLRDYAAVAILYIVALLVIFALWLPVF